MPLAPYERDELLRLLRIAPKSVVRERAKGVRLASANLRSRRP